MNKDAFQLLFKSSSPPSALLAAHAKLDPDQEERWLLRALALVNSATQSPLVSPKKLLVQITPWLGDPSRPWALPAVWSWSVSVLLKEGYDQRRRASDHVLPVLMAVTPPHFLRQLKLDPGTRGELWRALVGNCKTLGEVAALRKVGLELPPLKDKLVSALPMRRTPLWRVLIDTYQRPHPALFELIDHTPHLRRLDPDLVGWASSHTSGWILTKELHARGWSLITPDSAGKTAVDYLRDFQKITTHAPIPALEDLLRLAQAELLEEQVHLAPSAPSSPRPRM